MQKNHLTNTTSFYDLKKTFNKFDIEGIYLNIVKAIYDKPTANNIPNTWRLKSFALGLRIKQGCPLLSLLFSIELKS